MKINSNRWLYTGLIIICCWLTAQPAFAQTQPIQKVKKDSSEIQIKSADYLEIIQKRNVSINRLVNNVILVQKDLTLYCDSALLFKSENIATV